MKNPWTAYEAKVLSFLVLLIDMYLITEVCTLSCTGRRCAALRSSKNYNLLIEDVDTLVAPRPFLRPTLKFGRYDPLNRYSRQLGLPENRYSRQPGLPDTRYFRQLGFPDTRYSQQLHIHDTRLSGGVKLIQTFLPDFMLRHPALKTSPAILPGSQISANHPRQAINQSHKRILSPLRANNKFIEPKTGSQAGANISPEPQEFLSTMLPVKTQIRSTGGRILQSEFISNSIDTHPECGVSRSAQARILGGLDAGYGQFPWAAIVTVQGDDIDKMCSGTLINTRFVMTAGHCTIYCQELTVPECLDPVPDSELTYKISLGEYDYDQRKSDQVIQSYHAIRVYLHPKYRSNMSIREDGFVESDPHNDIALLELDRPVKSSLYISPICLPDPLEPLLPDLGTVIGWGRVGKEVGAPHSSVLQAVTVPILTGEECANMDGSTVPSIDQLCAGVSYADHSACPGDSGGGLMSRDYLGRWYILGIVSTGPAECGLTPVIYHNVSHTLPWTLSIINHTVP